MAYAVDKSKDLMVDIRLYLIDVAHLKAHLHSFTNHQQGN